MTNSLQKILSQAIAHLQMMEDNGYIEPAIQEQDSILRASLEWKPSQMPSKDEFVELDAAREYLTDVLWDYFDAKSRHKYILALVPPGVGKTYAAVQTAQDLAMDGKFGMFAMPTHAHFDNMMMMPHFKPELWQHWQSMEAISIRTGNQMCIHYEAMRKWTNKGYKSIDLCKMLCSGYIQDCEYRNQGKNQSPIIAGTHQHLTTGMNIAEPYSWVIVDENPMSAIIRRRIIPRAKCVMNCGGRLGELSERLHEIAVSPGKVMHGRELMVRIGGLIDDCIAQDDENIATPAVPYIQYESDVDQMNYWYVDDFLKAVVPEYFAYKHDAQDWLSRIYLTSEDLIILGKNQMANGMPSKVAILDATGTAALYREIFSKNEWDDVNDTYQKKVHPVYEMRVNVKTEGRIFQVTRRLNGISTMAKRKQDQDSELLSHGGEELEFIKRIVSEFGYKNYGCVTFMALENTGAYREYFQQNILHYYGQRGSNKLETCDALFVVGAPTPPYPDMEQTAKCLDMNRWQSFKTECEDGVMRPARQAKEQSYKVWKTVDGQVFQATRLIFGAWGDPLMRTIEQYYREDELVQSLHRCRPILHDCDVWVLTNIPTPELLTHIYEDPGEVFGAPAGFDWRAWCKAIDWGREHPDELVGYVKLGDNINGLDEITGLKECWLRRNNVLKELINGGYFESVELARTTRGKPPIIGRGVQE